MCKYIYIYTYLSICLYYLPSVDAPSSWIRLQGASLANLRTLFVTFRSAAFLENMPNRRMHSYLVLETKVSTEKDTGKEALR